MEKFRSGLNIPDPLQCHRAMDNVADELFQENLVHEKSRFSLKSCYYLLLDMLSKKCLIILFFLDSALLWILESGSEPRCLWQK
jgi:hypothetical protein